MKALFMYRPRQRLYALLRSFERLQIATLYLYRAYKDGVSDTQIENLKEKIYRGIATRADITRVTRRLGDEIAHVYGFPIPRRQMPVQER